MVYKLKTHLKYICTSHSNR